jgi:hypothetical protein
MNRAGITSFTNIPRQNSLAASQPMRVCKGAIFLAIVHCAALAMAQSSAPWRAVTWRTTLKNDAIEADFQSGLLYELKDAVTGKVFAYTDPANIPASPPLFGKLSMDLDACQVIQNASGNSLSTQFLARDGSQWELRWTIEPGSGDLVLQTSAHAPRPVDEMRVLFFGCDIAEHQIAWVDAGGVGRAVRAPWNDNFIGDPLSSGAPWTFVQPLVALFEGERAGWFIEGRDPKIGPSCCMVKGQGSTVNIGMIRSFPMVTSSPQMYEIRIRSYHGPWENAVEPYVQWMEKQGYIPLSEKSPAWVRQIKNQAYIPVGDFEDLEALAKRVNPSKTFIGRNADYRYYGFDMGYPDYRPTEGAAKWFRRARELGFHVGAHFNSMGISRMFPDLVREMTPGFAVTGRDGNGNPTYDSIYDGQMINCSAAYKPFRDLLIQRMHDAVAAGVDVIYLDETNGLGGKFVVGDVTAIQGLVDLEKEILEAYPNVAIETEQFNPVSSRYSSFALAEMPLGHPLSAYIFHRFIKAVPEGVMSAPTDEPMTDALQSWGCMTFGAGPANEWWLRMAKAFEDYDLMPDFRLDRQEFRNYKPDPTGGWTPVSEPISQGVTQRLFGYRGKNGVTAYFEKQKYQRGLVLYSPGKDPEWIGATHIGITSWPGPGAPEFEQISRRAPYWLLYNGQTVLGLDPGQSYYFTDSIKLPPAQFHVTRVPADFLQYYDGGQRIISQVVGDDDSYYKITFSGHGEIEAYIPKGYDAYLNDQKLVVSADTSLANGSVSTDPSRPAVLRAVRRIDRPLVGKWVELPWQGAWYCPGYVVANSDMGFTGVTTGIGTIVGEFPKAQHLHLVGSYGIPAGSNGLFGDGVVRINGKEVLRIPHGDPPFQMHNFDVDISNFSGRYAMLEFVSDGVIGGVTPAMQWDNPRIVATP